MRKRKSHRRVTKRELTKHQKLFWNRQADALLAHAESIWSQADGFDTAVRDSIAEGLAYIVNAAFDCQANAMQFENVNDWYIFIEASVAGWFRSRGFVEWFCGAAATLFHTTPPRTLAAVIDTRKPRKRR